MTVRFLVVGRLKESYLSEAVAEYQKRLSRYARPEWVEIEDERIPDSPSEGEKQAVLEAEGNRILAKIPKDAHVVTLEIEGREMTSPEFADFFGKLAIYGTSRIVFVIGGSLGLSAEVKKRADLALSFSRMTFPHQLMRVILIEQVYRAFSILNHTEYHK